MGVIQRQGTKNSIVQYVGVLIGAVSTLFIYPLDYSAYGLAQTCIDLVVFLTPIVTFGVTSLTIRFFPRFQVDRKDDNGYLGFLLAAAGGAIVAFGVLALLFGGYFSQLLELLNFDLSVFRSHWQALLVFLLIYILTIIFDNYIRNYNRIVVQSIFTSLLPKLGLPILVLLIVNQWLDNQAFVWGLVILYGVGLLGLIAYAWKITPFGLRLNSKILQPALRKEMRIYAVFAVFGTMGTILATQMDSLMISTLIDTTSTGIYKVTAFMAVVVEIPARAMRAIASPIIARAWEERDFAEIEKIYRRSSATLGFIGTGIFVLLAINVVDIIGWTPKPEELLNNLGVFYVLGLVRLIDLFTGVNSQIITFSDYFRFNIFAILILAVFNVVFNYVFIVYLGWGLLGVAMATFISLTLYNLAKYIFIQLRLGFQPFTVETVKIILVGLLCFTISFLPLPTDFSLLRVALRSVLGGGILLAAVWYWKICPEIKSMLVKNLLIIQDFFGRKH
jgi:O-antigen/teichoic acid export membrane protein